MPVLTMIVFLLPTTVSDIQMILKKKKVITCLLICKYQKCLNLFTSYCCGNHDFLRGDIKVDNNISKFHLYHFKLELYGC